MMKQWFTCSECAFKTEEFPKEIKIKDIEKVHGTHCPICGHRLVYNIEMNS